MSRPKAKTGLEHFVRLSRSIYLHEPSPKSRLTTSRDPDLILIVGWMDAQARHLSKYAARYEKLYQSARILIITTNTFDVLRSTFSNLRRVRPALDILYSTSADANAKLLLHSFSNGGGYTNTLIAKAYKKKMGRQIPLSAMILDSSPGRPDLAATRRAFAVGLPKNPILSFVGNMLFLILFAFLRIFYMLPNTTNIVEQLRVDLNDKTLYDVEVPRLYVFSDGDNMVEAKDVEDHGVEAKGCGYRVDMEKYIESGHAAHMHNDPERYWNAVRKIWESAI